MHPLNSIMIEKVISLRRRFGDEYFADLAFSFLNKLDDQNINYRVVYGNLDTADAYRSFNFNVDTSVPLIIFQLDYIDNVTELFNLIKQSNTQVILFSNQLTTDQVESDNLQIVHWGSDLLLQKNEYQTLNSINNKSFDADWHWVSLSLHPRLHRVISAIYLKGSGIDRHGHLRVNPCTLHDYNNYAEFNRLSTWKIPSEYSHILKLGFLKLKFEHTEYPDSLANVYPYGYNDNVRNFNQLHSLYESSAVEIVNETTFDSIGYHITEKFLNSVYGFNLPIILGPKGVVAYLKTLGFDMFDDIIDHSYDQIQTPILRIISAIEFNRRLLTDRDYAIQTWNICKDRLDANYNFAKTQLHTQWRSRVIAKMSDIIYWLK